MPHANGYREYLRAVQSRNYATVYLAAPRVNIRRKCLRVVNESVSICPPHPRQRIDGCLRGEEKGAADCVERKLIPLAATRTVMQQDTEGSMDGGVVHFV